MDNVYYTCTLCRNDVRAYYTEQVRDLIDHMEDNHPTELLQALSGWFNHSDPDDPDAQSIFIAGLENSTPPTDG